MSDFEPASVISTVVAAVVALVAIIWLLPLAVSMAWQVIPSILILIIVVGTIRGIVARLFD